MLLGIGFNYGDPWFLLALLIYGYYMAAFRNRPSMHPVSFLAVGIGLGTLFLTARHGVGDGTGKDASRSTPATWRASASFGCFRR